MNKRKRFISILAGIMAAIMILTLIISILPQANAASSSEIKKQIEEMEEEKKAINAEIAALKKQQNNNLEEMEGLVAEKASIDQQVQLLYAQIYNINDQLAAYNLLIADKQEELDAAEAHLADLNEKYKERIRAMEEDGELSYWSVLFAASSFSDLLDRLNMIEEIAASDQRRLAELRAAAEDVAVAKEALVVEKEALAVAKAELEASEVELAAKRDEADALLTAMKAKGDEFQQMIEKSEEDVEEMLQEIEKLEEEYDEAKLQEWLAHLATATTAPPPTTAPTVAAGGIGGSAVVDSEWLVPCTYSKVSSPFGMRLHPVDKVWKMHRGVDLSAPSGTPIYASKAGVVTIAGWDSSGGGNYVKLAHGTDADGVSWGSAYLHMTNYVVKTGDYVQAGQLIGYVGSTGKSTGPHLHFSIYKNGTAVNPMDYIG